MGGNCGTGRPIVFRCTRCRRRRNPLGGFAFDVKRTDRVRRTKSRHAGARMLPFEHEYVCRTCGHRGWTRHSGILLAPIVAEVSP